MERETRIELATNSLETLSGMRSPSSSRHRKSRSQPGWTTGIPFISIIQDVAGSPDLARTIFDKIDEAEMVVADASWICR
jgi:hypothetical protein